MTDQIEEVRAIADEIENDIREVLSGAWLVYHRLSEVNVFGGGVESDAWCMVSGNCLSAAQRLQKNWKKMEQALKKKAA